MKFSFLRRCRSLSGAVFLLLHSYGGDLWLCNHRLDKYPIYALRYVHTSKILVFTIGWGRLRFTGDFSFMGLPWEHLVACAGSCAGGSERAAVPPPLVATAALSHHTVHCVRMHLPEQTWHTGALVGWCWMLWSCMHLLGST
jgi:hypothetical protein